MREGIARRVRLRILARPGGGVLFERNEGGEDVPIRILGSEDAARRWAEQHYDDLIEGEDGVLFGLRDGPHPTREEPSLLRPGHPGPVTYETEEGDFRAHLPDLVIGDDGLVILQLCEEYDFESNRFEPFEAELWRSRRPVGAAGGDEAMTVGNYSGRFIVD